LKTFCIIITVLNGTHLHCAEEQITDSPTVCEGVVGTHRIDRAIRPAVPCLLTGTKNRLKMEGKEPWVHILHNPCKRLEDRDREKHLRYDCFLWAERTSVHCPVRRPIQNAKRIKKEIKQNL